MGFFLIALLITIGLILSTISSKISSINFLSVVLSLLFIVILSGFVRYTPDWSIYEYWFYEDLGRDIFFNFLRDVIVKMGYEYELLHLLFIVLSGTLLVLFIKQFEKNVFFVILLFFVIIFLFYTTQIRFFLGYFSCTYGLFLIFVQQKRKIGILFMLFGVLNHSSLVLFIPLIILMTTNIKFILKRTLNSAIIGFISLLFFLNIFRFLPFADRFNIYFSTEYISSFIGGIYSYLPFFIILFILTKYTSKKILSYPKLLLDKKFIFIYKLSIVSYVYIGISLLMQIFGQRFILPSILFQILLILYIDRYVSGKLRLSSIFTLTVSVIFIFIYLNVLPFLILNQSPLLTIKTIIYSNTIFNLFLS